MGTTQRIVPGVTGEPNWASLNGAITDLANTVKQDQEQDKTDSNNQGPADPTSTSVDQQQIINSTKYQQRLQTRKKAHLQKAMRTLIRTGGGRSKVSRGLSPSLGKGGTRVSRRISGFVTQVHREGLDTVLRRIGFGPIQGKTVQEVIDFLLLYFADTSAGMDDVAANLASCQVMEYLAENVKTLEAFEEKVHSLVEGNGLTELLCLYYGLYLFEHLSQRFQEKITQLKGEAVSRETFNIIKEDIIGQVTAIGKSKEMTAIDWKGPEGRAIEEKIFDSIIQIFE